MPSRMDFSGALTSTGLAASISFRSSTAHAWDRGQGFMHWFARNLAASRRVEVGHVGKATFCSLLPAASIAGSRLNQRVVALPSPYISSAAEVRFS